MKLLILDGNSILNRAFYGIKVLTTKEGLYTNGIYGFLTMLQRLRDEVDPNAVAVAFDRKEPTFRHKAYDGYKANRRGMPPELAQQLPILKELLTALGYRLVDFQAFRRTIFWEPWPPRREKQGMTASSPPETGTAFSWCPPL